MVLLYPVVFPTCDLCCDCYNYYSTVARTVVPVVATVGHATVWSQYSVCVRYRPFSTVERHWKHLGGVIAKILATERHYDCCDSMSDINPLSVHAGLCGWLSYKRKLPMNSTVLVLYCMLYVLYSGCCGWWPENGFFNSIVCAIYWFRIVPLFKPVLNQKRGYTAYKQDAHM